MKVWWCDYHKAEIVYTLTNECWDREDSESPSYHPCRMVEMRLVSVEPPKDPWDYDP